MEPQNIYFMGICGTAMGNVALLLHKQGHRVSGADTGIYPPMSDLLQNSGIELFDGYDEKRLEQLKPDLVVVGNVISRGNPEMEWLLESEAFPYVSLPELIGSKLLKGRKSVVISGTHGKTTTSTLAAYLARSVGDPGYLIGGVPKDFESGSHLGVNDAPFVIEGDEYDSAFFDKRSKFIHYSPHVLTINNLEFDHADIFRDLADVHRTFSHLLRIVPRNGFVLVNGEDENIKDLLPISWTTVYKVGTEPENDLVIQDFQETPEGASFTLLWQGQEWSSIEWQMPGLFNARNASMAALAVALTENPDRVTDFDFSVLSQFQGVKRRQETLLESEACIVIEDFAHHPTAVAAIVESLRNRYPSHHLQICFEPRSNTACKNIFQAEFTDAMRDADEVYIGALHRVDKLPAEGRLDSERMADDLRASGTPARAFNENKVLLNALVESQSRRSKDQPSLVCFFSNGSFDGIMQEFVAAVKR